MIRQPYSYRTDNKKDNIDKKIEYEEARIRRMELNLRDRYAALESMLNYYESVNTSLGQQIASIKSE